MPGGGMPGGVSDTSGDAVALRAPARPQHRGYIGGGQPPPTMVPQVRPSGLLEGVQDRLHRLGKYPRLRPEEEDLLCHSSIKTVCHFQVRPLPYQYPRQPSPVCPRLPDVAGHRRPVIISVCEHPPEVFELSHRPHFCPIGVERLF